MRQSKLYTVYLVFKILFGCALRVSLFVQKFINTVIKTCCSISHFADHTIIYQQKSLMYSNILLTIYIIKIGMSTELPSFQPLS